MRAQLFSMDFIVSIALVTLALGITLQAIEAPARQQAVLIELQNTTSTAIAQRLVAGAAVSCSIPGCCIAYSNGTSSCAALSCPKHVLRTQRLMLCSANAVCRVEVRTCG